MHFAANVTSKSADSSASWSGESGDGQHRSPAVWLEDVVTLSLLCLVATILWQTFPALHQRPIPQPPVAVLRSQVVISLGGDEALAVGDAVYFHGSAAPGSGVIQGLPGQVLTGSHSAPGAPFMMLGAGRFRVVSADGTSRVIQRADIRGRLYHRPG